ncbi:hypothetical protein EEJ31_00240 [Cryobacterium tepidiphilum]|uniref:Uncharacterized protein n=1 Tax=Cryobacterium tepidiphilum TaxID=2486026 RepID=A0A3M8LQT7_9MICO|nr:hypothetical protein EEJ31_00240 [Cryobacterium tepidiphilum]
MMLRSETDAATPIETDVAVPTRWSSDRLSVATASSAACSRSADSSARTGLAISSPTAPIAACSSRVTTAESTAVSSPAPSSSPSSESDVRKRRSRSVRSRT